MTNQDTNYFVTINGEDDPDNPGDPAIWVQREGDSRWFDLKASQLWDLLMVGPPPPTTTINRDDS